MTSDLLDAYTVLWLGEEPETDELAGVVEGDCIERMAELPDACVDAVVTDPPYGLGFMGRAWDDLPPGVEWSAECLRVLKPGGHLLAFGGTRTYHRLACAIEDAGLEIRDCLVWLYGSGFPKSHNLNGDWNGWGTALKPAHEPIVLARKPLIGTVAANVLAHGTGALNVDGCRIATGDRWEGSAPSASLAGGVDGSLNVSVSSSHEAGRWPANVVLDEDAAAMLDAQTGELGPGAFPARRGPDGDQRLAYGAYNGQDGLESRRTDSGGASRFFYLAKASSAERNAGLDGFELRPAGVKNASGRGYSERDPYAEVRMRNTHPTVKPIDLMRWLVRLVTPPGGLVLDPFAGSGTTGIACALEGLRFVGIEREPEYAEIARARLAWWSRRDTGSTQAVLASLSAPMTGQMELAP